jgi:hypothetical protein
VRALYRPRPRISPYPESASLGDSDLVRIPRLRTPPFHLPTLLAFGDGPRNWNCHPVGPDRTRHAVQLINTALSSKQAIEPTKSAVDLPRSPSRGWVAEGGTCGASDSHSASATSVCFPLQAYCVCTCQLGVIMCSCQWLKTSQSGGQRLMLTSENSDPRRQS